MKQLILLFAILIGMIFFTAWLQRGNLKFNLTPTPTPNPNALTINGKTITVEVADTPEEHEKGLSGRDNLPPDQGMLFVMPKDSTPYFWMRGMKFAIDIIWIDNDKVAGVTANLQPPEPGTSDDSLQRYQPPSPVDWVLEVNSGFASQNNITSGTSVTLPQGL